MKEDNKILKLVYTFFLGILLAIFVGVGVNTFYTPPKSPEFPNALNTYGKEAQLTSEQIAVEKEFNQKNESYNKQMRPYNRNVSMITLAAAVFLLVVSILSEKKIRIMSDGVMLGGLFTLIYSLGRGFASEDSKNVFGVVSIGLLVVLYLGYHRFVHEPVSDSKK